VISLLITGLISANLFQDLTIFQKYETTDNQYITRTLQKGWIWNKLTISNLHLFDILLKRETTDNERVSQCSTVFRMEKSGTLERFSWNGW